MTAGYPIHSGQYKNLSAAEEIRADTEELARKLAPTDGMECSRRGVNPWLDPDYTSCTPLELDGDEGVILCDFHAG